MADGCERHHHIGEKQEKGEPGGPGRIAGRIGFVEESLHFLGQFGRLCHSGGSGTVAEENFEGGWACVCVTQESISWSTGTESRAEGALSL